MAAGDAVGRYRSTVGRSKDPSGLLISVIRTLSTSDDVEDRENEKGRLEEAYEKCDRDLDELIVQHYTELTTAIRTYQSITERITNSRNKIKQVKENLLSCKMLLHCKRDELRKLWIEGIEHKHVLNLLDEIENIKQVPQKLEQCMASKRYLNATDMLVSAVDSLEGPLLQVEGLSDLRLELHSKKMNLHLVLIDELHRHLYIRSTNRVGQRGRDRARLGSLVKDSSPVPLMDVTNLSTPRKFLETSQFSTPGSSSMRDSSLLEIKEDTELDPEENSAVFMGILIKGLAKLKKIPETVKAIQDRLEQELKQIVKRSTTQVADNGYQRGENISQENQPRLLLELLELLFDKFNAVAAAHAVVLGHLQQTVASPCSQHDGDIKLYDMVDVWVKIQDVLQVRAAMPAREAQPCSSNSPNLAFRGKKKPNKRSLKTPGMQLGPLLVITHPTFPKEPPTDPGWGAEINFVELLLTAGLLSPPQSTVIVEKTVQDLMELMHDLSAYSDQFLHMVCVKLQEYKDTCTLAYRTIVQSDEKLVISASWAKDDDISRLLKSLPNWSNMAQPKQLRPKREEEEDFIRAAFGKESEVLIGNLGDKLIPQQEILRDVSDLKALANLHESLEWLAARTKAAFSSLSAAQTTSPGQESHGSLEHLPASEQILQSLSELARSFQEMADRCLLVLHLEVRVHCFHYLIPLAKQGNYAIVANVESMDYDPLVVRLNKDISAIEEAMGASLQQHKFQYIFEGLGHLISCILINGAHYFKRISESGIKKMCRNIFILQQNLTNITMSREADLDFARQYYEMLYNTADELLNLVVDQGVKYTELEYIYALNLLHRSQTGVGDQTTQNMRLQRLKEIICEQAAIKQATKDKKITTV
uniref:Exocyst complex component Sec8 n=1 Tax=Serinus canaria TaxID=9135 RepID=A0A8C9NDF8_SERCA